MSDLCRRFQLMLFLAAIALLATACFRDTSEAIQNQPVAREYPSPTAVQEAASTAVAPTEVAPTEVAPTATEEPVAPVVEVIEPEIDQFALTATALIARQTQPALSADASSGSGAAAGDTSAGPAPALQPPRATIPPGEDCVHEIRAGDTLFQLSLAYGVTVDAIAKASAIANPDRIAVGQQITIPLCGTTGFIPPPTSLPTATIEAAQIAATSEPQELEIASSDDTRNALIAQAQETLLDNAQSEQAGAFSAQLAVEATASRTYTVQQNDTLFEIAVRYGTTVEILAALNGIADINSLNAGDVLQIP